jgi:hypothetical protein
MSKKIEPTEAPRRLGFLGRRILGGRLPIGGLVAALAVVALLGAGYVIGNPPSASHDANAKQDAQGRFAANPLAANPVAAPTAGPAQVPAASAASGGGIDQGLKQYELSGDGSQTTSGVPVTAPIETQIVKTGSMAMEVANLDNALSAAQAAIVGLGGSISSSTRSGSEDQASATVTYRIPVARWDDALAAIDKLGKLLGEQTGTTDVTAQVVDVDARLTNLRATESALQGIMARASAIPDILAVQQQLTETRSQIEQLEGQENYLKDQAAMSTLSVSYTLPGKTVVTSTTQDWDLGKQVDNAVATLVRMGQGLATLAVWLVIVGLPLIVSLLILYVVYRIGRRIARRRASQAA